MNFVSEDIYTYCENHSTLPSRICEEIEEFTQKNVPMAVMLTGPLVGSFLGFIIRLTGAKSILEVGTYTGYSALCMAEQLPEGGELVTLDVSETVHSIAKGFWQKSAHGKKITAITGPALQSMESLKGNFDLVFLDADKENYLNYLKFILPRLNPNGAVLVDNTLWSGRVLEENPAEETTRAIKEFNDWVAANKDLTCCLVPLRDGIMMIQKKTYEELSIRTIAPPASK